MLDPVLGQQRGNPRGIGDCELNDSFIAQPRQWALVAQFPRVDDAHGISHLLDLRQDVGGDDHRHSLLPGQRHDQLPDLGDPGRVQAIGRFVQQNQLRIRQQRHRQP
jgi:hypothetical protein